MFLGRGVCHGVRFPCWCAWDECAGLHSWSAHLDRATCREAQRGQWRHQDVDRARPLLRVEFPDAPQLSLSWALAEARTFHLQGLGRLARAERSAAKQRAEQEAPAYLAAETARLREIRHQLTDEAEHWWQALLANDEGTVCEAVNTAFSDNPAAGCAVGVDGSVLSVVVRQQDLDSMPGQTPGLTPSGRPTLKNLTKRDRVLWWLTSMGSNIVATLKEGFATAPGITAIDLAVLTRLPDTQRLGFVAYGRWTRQAIESTPWREPEDALRFQDIGQDVACSVTTTASGNLSSAIKPLDRRHPRLQYPARRPRPTHRSLPDQAVTSPSPTTDTSRATQSRSRSRVGAAGAEATATRCQSTSTVTPGRTGTFLSTAWCTTRTPDDCTGRTPPNNSAGPVR